MISNLLSQAIQQGEIDKAIKLFSDSSNLQSLTLEEILKIVSKTTTQQDQWIVDFLKTITVTDDNQTCFAEIVEFLEGNDELEMTDIQSLWQKIKIS